MCRRDLTFTAQYRAAEEPARVGVVQNSYPWTTLRHQRGVKAHLSTSWLPLESAGRKERGKVVALTNAFAKAYEAPVSSGVPGTAQTGRPLLTDTIVSGVCARSLVSHLSTGRQPEFMCD